MIPDIYSNFPQNGDKISINYENDLNRFELLGKFSSIDSIEKNGVIEITPNLLIENGQISIICSDNAYRVFDKDQVFNPSNVNNISSSGLSLLIAKQLITDHGGSLNLLSSAKGDTRFEVQLSCELYG